MEEKGDFYKTVVILDIPLVDYIVKKYDSMRLGALRYLEWYIDARVNIYEMFSLFINVNTELKDKDPKTQIKAFIETQKEFDNKMMTVSSIVFISEKEYLLYKLFTLYGDPQGYKKFVEFADEELLKHNSKTFTDFKNEGDFLDEEETVPYTRYILDKYFETNRIKPDPQPNQDKLLVLVNRYNDQFGLTNLKLKYIIFFFYHMNPKNFTGEYYVEVFKGDLSNLKFRGPIQYEGDENDYLLKEFLPSLEKEEEEHTNEKKKIKTQICLKCGKPKNV